MVQYPCSTDTQDASLAYRIALDPPKAPVLSMSTSQRAGELSGCAGHAACCLTVWQVLVDVLVDCLKVKGAAPVHESWPGTRQPAGTTSRS